MKRPVIGILTWREGKKFAEPAYFRRLIRAGQALGSTVFLFSPQDVSPSGRQVRGFVPDGRSWQARMFTRPDVVIDRYRYTPTAAFRQYVAFRRTNGFLYANNRLANKWKVHEVLWRDARMHRWLPEAMLYNHVNLPNMLARHSLLYLKPLNGTGGRGIVRLEKTAEGYRLLGRSKDRAKVSALIRRIPALLRWIDRWKNEKLIVQQGLRLDLVPKRSVDMRLLIQKDGDGRWSITGAGMRVGGERSATANLHGGGKAVPAQAFLRSRFGEQRAREIIRDCEQLAYQTAETIENHFGRMIELGLDIGIDVDGRAWLIEVNPKPGREIFRELGTPQVYREAIRKPIQYALHLARQQSGGERQTARAALR
jgi:glutathione synthase/RimK-type ligase-like ATP-grasp enzyme